MELVLLSIDFTFCQSKRCPRYCDAVKNGCGAAKRCLTKTKRPQGWGKEGHGIPKRVCVDPPVQNPNTNVRFKGKGADEHQEVSRASVAVADDVL